MPVQLTRIENPDLRNVEFSGRALEKRNGFYRVNATQFFDSSVKYDGDNDFLNIRYQPRYQPTYQLFVSFDTILQRQTATETTVISRGYGTGANRFLKISYDPTANSNNGGWRCRVRDATANANRDVTVNDGTGTTGAVPYGVYRHVEFKSNAGVTAYNLIVYDAAGAVVGTSSDITVGSFITDSNPWWIGVDTNGSSGTVRGTDYYGGLLAEIRMADVVAVPNCAGIIGRELYSDPSSAERTGLIGYWKLNDGQGPTFADTYQAGTNNPAIAGGAGHRWITNSSLAVLGTALEFYGAYDPGALAAPAFFGSFVWWQNALAVATTAGSADPFTDTLGGAFRNWCVDTILVPRMAQGETTVRNQTLIWAGTDATNPHPIGLRVVSNRLQGYYYDGTTLLTLSAPAKDLSELVDTRCHVGIRLFRHPTTAAIDRLEVFIRKDSNTSPFYWSATTDTANPAINPTVGSIEGHWGIGDKLNSVTAVPPTTRGDNAFCILQNVSIRANNNVGWATTPMGFAYPASFIPQPILFANVVLCGQVPLDDGQRRTLRTTGAFLTAAALYPDPYDGFRLGEGLVTPQDAPFAQGLLDWRRIDPDGNIKRSALVVSGSTFYDVDIDGGTSVVRVSGIPKSTGPYVAAQYGTDIIVAGRNGIRPFIISDNSSHLVGIEAPQTAPVITSDTASGSIPSGTYTVYVTYCNDETGNESNPSPSASFTLGATGRIDAVAIPISADPQVNQRRIWVTAAGGGTAYLQATVYDNSTTSYTTDITTIATTTSLDLTGHEEAPIGSLVAVWKDRLWVAGNNLKPTRIFFSAPGNLQAFNHTAQTDNGGAGYLDADLDTGDVCVALVPMLNQLVAYFRDGIVEITATGDTTDPFFMTFKSKQTGSVGPLAVIPYESGAFYAGERDFFLFDGFNSVNLSSPTQEGRPSIQQFVRNSLEPSRRKDISLAIHRSKNQLWASCSLDGATRNDVVLVFDFSQGIWSRYSMDMDALLEIEDDQDEPWLYGTSRGHLVKLDNGTYDGYSTAVESGVATSGTTSSLVRSTATFTANAYKGLYVWWYDVSATTTRSARIARNSTTTLFFTETTTAPESGDPYVVGSFPWYADFIVDYGNPLSNYKLKWFVAKGESDATNYFRLSIEADIDGRTWTYAATEWTEEWAATEKFIRIPLGGIGRSFRMRVADTGLTTATGSTPAPSSTGKISIFEMNLISERMEAL